MKDREQLINRLVGDLTTQPQPWSVFRVAVIWWLCSWVYVALATLAMGSLRPTAIHDVTSNHHFQIESLIGFIVSLLLALAAWYSTIPAALTRKIFCTSAGLFSLWVLFYIFGLYEPAITPSMLGKREHCYLESYLYSTPPMLCACYLMAKRFPLNQYQSGLLIGLAAGIMPALFMQFACIYDPAHILKLHLLPGLSMGIVGVLLFPFMHTFIRKNNL